ncbi:hypothetical protein HMPREF0742_01603 [Rothia aeria F0184]|uniref:Uncharacterized protein n=1 Tax=Rothia aeria F0184 TaxID=888019 RepID=U7V4X6_9MICC|nr:hypothetical protein HMPREF0742_01603 [Rothia aeria F0184]
MMRAVSVRYHSPLVRIREKRVFGRKGEKISPSWSKIRFSLLNLA